MKLLVLFVRAQRSKVRQQFQASKTVDFNPSTVFDNNLVFKQTDQYIEF